MSADFALALIVTIGITVILGLPEIFWNVMKVFFIVACALVAVMVVHELTIAAPVVVVSFLSGAALAGMVLLFTKKL